MADGEPQPRGENAPRISPQATRRYRRGLLGAIVAIPMLAAVYGFHRGGGGGAAVGAVCAIWGAAMFSFPVVSLLRWLSSPRTPPLWRHERIYWSLTAAIAVAWLVAGVAVLGAFDPIEEHGLDGYIDGVIAGVTCAALFAIAAGWLHAWLMWLRGPAVADEPKDRSELQEMLAPTLAELEAVRLDAGRHIRRRAAWLTPIGAGVLLVAWVIWLSLGGDLNLLAPPLAIFVGGLAGHVMAVRRLAADYERRYRARVLPLLAALFGSLTFERPPPPDLRRLREFHVFRHFDSVRAEDSICGQCRGLRLSIVQLDLSRGWGPWRERVFDGLLIKIELKNRLAGTTAIASDAGAFGNLRDELAARNIRQVGAGEPRFRARIPLKSTELTRCMARALLTPDFMERFTALGTTEGYGRPLALAENNLLLVAMPKAQARAGTDDFFAPPGYDTPASDDEVLGRLYDDIGTVLRLAEPVIALDDATRQAATSRRRTARGLARLERLLASLDRQHAGARHLDQAQRAHQVGELVDLRRCAGDLKEDEALGRRVDHVGAEDVGDSQRLDPVRRPCHAP